MPTPARRNEGVSFRSRFEQAVFVVSAMLLAWLWMQGVHELGHCLGAWSTGGRVEKVVLHPLAISRTDVDPNPSPLVVVWAGPVGGILIPLILWGGLLVCLRSIAWFARFFAGFCLLANGIYIGVGSVEGIGDAGDMLRHGSPLWLLWVFGVATAPWGLVLWNGLGPKFGFAKEPIRIPPSLIFGCLAALAVTIAAEFCLSDSM